jgi:hypothetical protein
LFAYNRIRRQNKDHCHHGEVSANNLALNATPGNDVKVAFIGQASLTKFATVEKANAEDFLKWKSLYLNGINANTGPPFRLEINEVALADFYSRLIINSDATLNVQGIVASEPKASAKVEPGKLRSDGDAETRRAAY